jgi:hypothetical protein
VVQRPKITTQKVQPNTAIAGQARTIVAAQSKKNHYRSNAALTFNKSTRNTNEHWVKESQHMSQTHVTEEFKRVKKSQSRVLFNKAQRFKVSSALVESTPGPGAYEA